jgi:hypothetical protein
MHYLLGVDIGSYSAKGFCRAKATLKKVNAVAR